MKCCENWDVMSTLPHVQVPNILSSSKEIIVRVLKKYDLYNPQYNIRVRIKLCIKTRHISVFILLP